MITGITPDLASRFARIALGHVTREYPHKLGHVLNGDADARTPRDLHPIFFGSYDWHSCVHGYWLLARLLRTVPELPESADIRALFDEMFTAKKAEAERVYLDRPGSAGFERPYGWTWLLMLHAELAQHPDTRWADTLRPLADVFAARFHAFLPKLTYPIRVGTHFNTAFALVLAHEWAVTHDAALVDLIDTRARHWFGNDRDCQAWEPGGDDFLSSALIVALCMQRVLPAADFAQWLAGFLPRLEQGAPATLSAPATVSDRSDGKNAHLDGLNLRRAWRWR